MVQYHVTLNSQGYVLDLDRYARRIRDPFVPRQGQGSVAVGDLRGPEQVLVISDWSGGEGSDRSTDVRRALVWLIDDPSLTGWQRATLAELPAPELTLARIDQILRIRDTP